MIEVHIHDDEDICHSREFEEHLQNGLTDNSTEFSHAGITVSVEQTQNDLTTTTIITICNADSDVTD